MAEHATALPPVRRRRRPDGAIGLNLTAMIDVTFLLLIYFMAATRFTTGEEVYRLDLPERGRAVAADPLSLPEEPLVIEVGTIPGATVGDDAVRLRLPGPWPQPRTFDELHEILHARVLTLDNPGGLFAPDHPVTIAPARAASWQHAMAAFDAAVRAGFENVTLAGGES